MQEVLLPACYDGESAAARRYRDCALTACCSIVQRCYEGTLRSLCCDVLNELSKFLAQSHTGFAGRCGRVHTAHLVVPLNLCEHSTMSAMVKAQLTEKLKGVDRCVMQAVILCQNLDMMMLFDLQQQCTARLVY
jgi:hypothetical protein